MSNRGVSEAIEAGRRPGGFIINWVAHLAGARGNAARHLSQALALACLLALGCLPSRRFTAAG